ncbi:MAG: hypothetical protein LBT92_02220, partial [Rickettsiales bacterium]|nr:hypothetical protein [Rickettsiales bacterium]
MEGISVVGCGRWGTFLAWYAATHCGIPAVLYGRSSSPDFIELRDTGRNRYLSLPRGVSMTDDLDAALGNDTIVVSIGSQNLRGFCREVAGRSLPGRGGLAGKTFLLAMKGLETPSAKVLSQVFREELGETPRLAILAGPGHVQDYVREIPSCAVVDSDDAKVKEGLAGSLSSRLIRFYIGGDFVGNQVGAALKNVV